MTKGSDGVEFSDGTPAPSLRCAGHVPDAIILS
ncbi:hypothetical protein FHX49_001577 [Microbacterium endophyticum]|uniref:Uncharacterized protein n=1 Tax=Microbacterium endophyticum TaxID=1526412 RepID=A0A7W4V351_9MICO|nr:hypothetical protein [Microbacterium endophyticum]NIK35074.1 hypothetical protein [Microbacterium endophyticum]